MSVALQKPDQAELTKASSFSFCQKDGCFGIKACTPIIILLKQHLITYTFKLTNKSRWQCAVWARSSSGDGPRPTLWSHSAERGNVLISMNSRV